MGKIIKQKSVIRSVRGFTATAPHVQTCMIMFRCVKEHAERREHTIYLSVTSSYTHCTLCNPSSTSEPRLIEFSPNRLVNLLLINEVTNPLTSWAHCLHFCKTQTEQHRYRKGRKAIIKVKRSMQWLILKRGSDSV